MLEIESKFQSPGNEKVKNQLIRLGATRVSESMIEDVYFAHPSRDFSKSDEALRLRKTGECSELTYKGPRMRLDNAKAREEITLKTDNPLAVQRIVERLGFKEFCTIKKSRASYIIDKLRIDVDYVEGLGEYIELEVLTESPEVSIQLLELARKELELDRMEPKTYLELVIERKVDHRNKT